MAARAMGFFCSIACRALLQYRLDLPKQIPMHRASFSNLGGNSFWELDAGASNCSKVVVMSDSCTAVALSTLCSATAESFLLGDGRNLMGSFFRSSSNANLQFLRQVRISLSPGSSAAASVKSARAPSRSFAPFSPLAMPLLHNNFTRIKRVSSWGKRSAHFNPAVAAVTALLKSPRFRKIIAALPITGNMACATCLNCSGDCPVCSAGVQSSE
mmetsp:Transcript_12740/g.36675  ORF Transcript_12740/g.36675 Transcript_12740/m.36675 type:complete len:214 (+) Transcript_12740:342-983(+)